MKEVRLSVFKKNGEWYDTIEVEFEYEDRKELIYAIKTFKATNYSKYILLLTHEYDLKVMPHLFM